MFTPTDNSVPAQKTRELCQSILEQPAYQMIRQQIDAFQADASAQSQFQSVLELGDQLQQKQRAGRPMSGEEIDAFEEKRQALMENPVARGFLEAQEAMHVAQRTVNQYVAKTFELGRLPSPEDLHQHQEGGCGSGCGCGH